MNCGTARLFILILLTVVAAKPAQAQFSPRTPAPWSRLHTQATTTSQAVPDTANWRRYFPLQIGNQWQYRIEYSGGGSSHYGYEIVGDTLFDDEQYFVVRTCYERPPGEPPLCSDSSTINSYDYVRYDTVHALIVERLVIENVPQIEWWARAPCKLDIPFNAGPLRCTEPSASWEYFTSGGYGYTHVIGLDTLRNVTYKEFDSVPVITGVVAGLGVVWNARVHTSEPSIDELVYARIGVEEYGTSHFPFPTARQPDEEVVTADPELARIYPNPAQHRLTLDLNLPVPGNLLLEVYDVLGRLTLQEERAVGVGVQLVQLDVSELPSAAYFVRFSFGGSVVTARSFVIAR